MIRRRKGISFIPMFCPFVNLFLLAILLAGSPSASLENPLIPVGSDQPVPASFFGMHIHRAGGATPWPQIPFAEWRLWDAYVAWPSLEPRRGQWHFETLDLYVELAERGGVGLLLPLGLSPAWASARPSEKSAYTPGNAAEPMDIQDWRTYVRTVATRYKGRIREYEIWNEPNLKGFWTGDVGQMVDLTREASEVIHGIDPGATLVSPSGTSPNGIDWLREFLARGGGQYVDVIGYHFYVFPHPPELMVPLINDVREVMQQNGAGDKPLWNTETGWAYPKPFPSRELGAAYLVRAHLLAWISGVQRFYWYAWDNHAWVSLETTERDNRTPTPAGRAYAIMQDWLVRARLKGCKEDVTHTWICQLERGRAPQWIVWNSDGAKPVELTKEPGAISVTPLLGVTRRLSSTSLEVNEIPELISSAEP